MLTSKHSESKDILFDEIVDVVTNKKVNDRKSVSEIPHLNIFCDMIDSFIYKIAHDSITVGEIISKSK